MDNIAWQIGQAINGFFSDIGAHSLTMPSRPLGYFIIFFLVIIILGSIGEGNKIKKKDKKKNNNETINS